MRNLFGFLLLLLNASFTAFSQADTSQTFRIQHGLIAGADASGLPNNFSFSLFYSVEKGRHKLAVGPYFGKKLDIFENTSTFDWSYPFTLSGLGMLYQFYPNPRGKRYDLYFQYELACHRFSDRGSRLNAQSLTVNYKASDLYVLNLVSYGLRVRFLRHFSLNHNIGMGYLWNQRRFNGRKIHRKESGLQGNLRVGLTFTFPNRRK